jgi:hypothetical protein
MSLPISTGRKWLLSTCRGRVKHLRAHLPTWLALMPHWEPCIVCCDDSEAFEYAAGELVLAGRGLCLSLEQGQFFNRLEAIRAGIRVIRTGIAPTGQGLTAEHYMRTCRGCSSTIADDDVVAMWDCDAVALRGTERALSAVGPGEVAIAGSTARQEMGILVAPVALVAVGLEEIPVGMFADYGHEDCALRLGVWAHCRQYFVRLRPCWSRANHPDRMRREHYRDLMDVSGQRNGLALAELVARLLKPEEISRWRADCYFPGTYQTKAMVRRAG